MIKRWRRAAANGDDGAADVLEAERSELERGKARAEALDADRQKEAEQEQDKVAQREARKARDRAAKVQAAFDRVGELATEIESILDSELGERLPNGQNQDAANWQKWLSHARKGGRFDVGSVSTPANLQGRSLERSQKRVLDLAIQMHQARGRR